jgi:hypothetical protein
MKKARHEEFLFPGYPNFSARMEQFTQSGNLKKRRKRWHKDYAIWIHVLLNTQLKGIDVRALGRLSGQVED